MLQTYWANLRRNTERSSYFTSPAITNGLRWFQTKPPMRSFHNCDVCVSIEMAIFLDFLAYAVLPLQSRDRIDLMEQLFVLYEPSIRPSPGPPPPTLASSRHLRLEIVAKYELLNNSTTYTTPSLLPKERKFALLLRRSEGDGALLVDVPHALVTALRKSPTGKTNVKRLLSEVRPVSPHLTVPLTVISPYLLHVADAAADVVDFFLVQDSLAVNNEKTAESRRKCQRSAVSVRRIWSSHTHQTVFPSSATAPQDRAYFAIA